MFIYRRLLEFQFRLNLLTLLDGLYRHEKLAAHYYCRLTAQAKDVPKQSKFLALATASERKTSDYARRICLSGAVPPKEFDDFADKLWYWLLLHSGQYLACHWLVWSEYRKAEALNSLLFARYIW